jgi:hypothetical protein
MLRVHFTTQAALETSGGQPSPHSRADDELRKFKDMSLTAEDKEWIKSELERFEDAIVERVQDYISATLRQRSHAVVLRMMELERRLLVSQPPSAQS